MLYSLTAGARELLHLRTPALADLHLACAAASLACAKPAALPQAAPAAVSLPLHCTLQRCLLWAEVSTSVQAAVSALPIGYSRASRDRDALPQDALHETADRAWDASWAQWATSG